MILSIMAKHDIDLSLVFHALSDPTRRAMLAQIGGGAVAVTVLARPTGLALPTVMRHLSVLEAAGLIVTDKAGRSRLCRVQPQTLTFAGDWLAQARAEWSAQTDRLEAFMNTMEEDNGPESRDRP